MTRFWWCFSSWWGFQTSVLSLFLQLYCLISEERATCSFFQALFHYSWKESSLCISNDIMFWALCVKILHNGRTLSSSVTACSFKMVLLLQATTGISCWNIQIIVHMSTMFHIWSINLSGFWDYCPPEMPVRMNHYLVSCRPTELLWGGSCQSNVFWAIWDEMGFGYAEQPTRMIKHHQLCLMSVKRGSQGNRPLVAMPTADILFYGIKLNGYRTPHSPNNGVAQWWFPSAIKILWPCVWMMDWFKMPHRHKTDKPNSENDSRSSPLTLPTCEVRRTDPVSASIWWC